MATGSLFMLPLPPRPVSPRGEAARAGSWPPVVVASSAAGTPPGSAPTARPCRRRPPSPCASSASSSAPSTGPAASLGLRAQGALAGACAPTPGPAGAAPVRGRSHSSAGLRANKGRLWPLRKAASAAYGTGSGRAALWATARFGLEPDGAGAHRVRAVAVAAPEWEAEGPRCEAAVAGALSAATRTISRLSVTCCTLKTCPEHLVVAAVIKRASPFPRHRTKTPRECSGGAGEAPEGKDRPRRRDHQAGLAAPKEAGGHCPGAVPAQIDPKGIVREHKTPMNRRQSPLRRRAAPVSFKEVHTMFETLLRILLSFAVTKRVLSP